jgi:hypothetical protein
MYLLDHQMKWTFSVKLPLHLGETIFYNHYCVELILLYSYNLDVHSSVKSLNWYFSGTWATVVSFIRILLRFKGAFLLHF